jgi:hypothetical protein
LHRCEVTRHSIVRVLSSCSSGWGSDRVATAIGREKVSMTTTTDEERPSAALVEVVLGVDTHLDVHVAVALDHLGRRLGVVTLPTTQKGYERLLSWAQALGPVRCAGVEGTPAATGP